MMNKTVLITGVTGTIGKATALEIAKSGVPKAFCSIITPNRQMMQPG